MQKHKVVTMKLSDLKAAEYNPRKITRKALEGLQNSLKEFGAVQPIVWNKKTKQVVGGHQRIVALRAIGETEAPVVVVELSEEKEKVLNITLNNTKIEGEFTDTLDDLLKEIQAATPDLYRSLRMDTLQRGQKKVKEEPGEIEFTEELLESMNYPVLYTTNEIDWLHVQTIAEIKTVKALDSKPGFVRTGVGRIMKATDFIDRVKGRSNAS